MSTDLVDRCPACRCWLRDEQGCTHPWHWTPTASAPALAPDLGLPGITLDDEPVHIRDEGDRKRTLCGLPIRPGDHKIPIEEVTEGSTCVSCLGAEIERLTS